jgi:methylmalonyl-CoA mutase
MGSSRDSTVAQRRKLLQDGGMDDLPLAAEFPPATREDWLRRVETVLKGADFEKKLVSRSYDGLRTEPLYEKASGEAPRAPRAEGLAAPWMILQRVDHPEPEAANRLALDDLENGAGGVALVLAGAPTARGFGLDARTVDDLDRALAGVMLDMVGLRIETAPFLGRMVAALVTALAERRGLSPAALDIDFGLDPIGDIARTGGASLPWPALSARAAEVATALAERGFTRSLLRADARAVHEAGGSQAQELAAALATGVAYLRLLEAKGWTLDAARQAISFLMVADADAFLTLAKFRALRRLWARVEEACGLAPKPARVQAETAWRMTTRRDPWVNMLRGAIAAFSAGLGGADSVTVLPFTAALGLPDAFARRIARNTQLILLEESNLWRVADPAAGSGGFEALTDALCEKAWELFQEIEREAGIVASLQAGFLQARIAETRAAREQAVATRRDPITGTSEFPHLGEAPVTVLDAPSPALGVPPRGLPADFSALVGEARSGRPLAGGLFPMDAMTVEALPSQRAAEPYERLRDRSDALVAETGARPNIFLANLGPIAAFTARAMFAQSFFEAGGVEAIANEGFADHGALAAAFRGSGAKAACLCSSDEIYATQGAAAARALKGAGCGRLFLAGGRGVREAELREAGVDEFIFAGSDLLSSLRLFYKEEGKMNID